MYTYNAKVIRVVDGDTMDVEIDLGFFSTRKERLRLYGINAYEVKLYKGVDASDKEKGILCKEHLKKLLEGNTVRILTYKDKKGKYGRYLADMWMMNEGVKTLHINQYILDKGWGVKYLI